MIGFIILLGIIAALVALGAATLRGAVGDVGAGTVSTIDVSRVGQPSIDRADRVRVYSKCRSQLADGRQARARQQPARVDLVRELPIDLGGDRNVRITLDIERPGGPARRQRYWRVIG